MKIRIKAKCHDKVTGKQYKPGDVLEVSKKRGAEMCAVSGGMYAEVVEKVPAEEPVEPQTDAKEAPQAKPAKKKSTKKAKSE